MPQYSDLDLDFLQHPITSDIVVLEDDVAIKRSVRNLILTSFYDRPFHPEIGCRLSTLLFEPISPITKIGIQKSIIEMLAAYEPRINVVLVDVQAQPHYNRYSITIEYTIIGYATVQTTTLYIERTR